MLYPLSRGYIATAKAIKVVCFLLPSTPLREQETKRLGECYNIELLSYLHIIKFPADINPGTGSEISTQLRASPF